MANEGLIGITLPMPFLAQCPVVTRELNLRICNKAAPKLGLGLKRVRPDGDSDTDTRNCGHDLGRVGGASVFGAERRETTHDRV